MYQHQNMYVTHGNKYVGQWQHVNSCMIHCEAKVGYNKLINTYVIHCNTIVAIPTHKHKCDTMQHNSRLEPAHKHIFDIFNATVS
mgnify:CR=1 FL=1